MMIFLFHFVKNNYFSKINFSFDKTKILFDHKIIVFDQKIIVFDQQIIFFDRIKQICAKFGFGTAAARVGFLNSLGLGVLFENKWSFENHPVVSSMHSLVSFCHA